ncbi:MAG: radical SAM protein [Clostridia bacterium]|nr:radical SAM protein [Clostridia bacterium]
MRHINIPIFIPHMGCPNDCVFCNQRRISGKTEFDITSVEAELERAVSTIEYDTSEVEIAFFGGSFTGIDRADMLYLLGLAKRYVDYGKATSIRLSTRPDYIDGEILDILAAHHVTDIELGLQSMSDRVLAASKRGHTAECARAACRMIKAQGFNLVGQMMIGLPSSTEADEVETAREIVSLGCDAARIYPTVVFCETALCDMMHRGEYIPLSHDGAVNRSAAALSVFAEHGLPVIRLGLCAADNLFEPGTIAGGAYHSAMGEMVYSELYMRRIREYIAANGLSDKLAGKNIKIHVPVGETSKVSGQKRCNKLSLQNEYNVKSVKIIENPSLLWYNIKIEY